MHPKNIPNFHETVLQKVKNFCEDLDKLVDQGPFDFSTYSKSFFLEMIFGDWKITHCLPIEIPHYNISIIGEMNERS